MKLGMGQFSARMIRQWRKMRVKESPAQKSESGEAQGEWTALRGDTVAILATEQSRGSLDRRRRRCGRETTTMATISILGPP